MRVSVLLLIVALACCEARAVKENKMLVSDLKRVTQPFPEFRERLSQLVDVDDGACLGCVLVLDLLDMNIEEHAEQIDSILVGLCTLIDKPVQRRLCENVVSNYGVDLIRFLLDTHGPNKICQQLGVCESCHLVLPKAKEHTRERAEVGALKIGWALHVSAYNAQLADSELPARDEDGDRYSGVQLSRRGAMWRGRDCNEIVSDIHPGLDDDPSGLVDNNCNGIYGLDPNSGRPYEEELCTEASSRRDVVVFGDSASAGFHIPAEWLNFQNLSTVPQEAIDEFDVPEESWCTGFTAPVGNASIALFQEERNRCNHRSFQNLAKNGAKMVDLVKQTTKLGNYSHPMLGFIAYIGNDICKDSLAKMTTPEQYEQELLEGLAALDTVTNPGSKIILTGLADGSVLWDTMHNRTHPLGCTYAALYEFLTCTGGNPCNTWLTSDDESRKQATERAMELSMVGKAVVEETLATKNYTNFDIRYIDYPVNQIFEWVDRLGGEPSALIETVDGFHPSLYAHRITAHVLNGILLNRFPEYIGTHNQNNGKIQSVFGDQGGF